MRLFSRLPALALFLSPAAALAQSADPQGSGPIVAALAWLQGTLLGNRDALTQITEHGYPVVAISPRLDVNQLTK